MSAVIREHEIEPAPPRAARAHEVHLSADEVTALEADLRGRIRGEVRFDAGSRALYATDASNYRQTPIGVVVPRDAEDAALAVAAARRHGAPIPARGGGTLVLLLSVAPMYWAGWSIRRGRQRALSISCAAGIGNQIIPVAHSP